MNTPLLHVGLDSWIIQDGNYGEFASGETTKFALEFCSEEGLSVVKPDSGQRCLRHTGDSIHKARGVVCFTSANCWVIDFGDVMAFCEERPPTQIVKGVEVEGELSLGIDPFSYFERLAAVPGIPPLIYEWRIEAITLVTGPLVASISPYGTKVFVRDPARLQRLSIAKTDAWHDDSGRASYVLACRRTSPSTFRSIDGDFPE